MTEEKKACLKCGGTGLLLNGDKCDCGVVDEIILPECLKIPNQYQSIRFDKSFLRKEMQNDYGVYMERLINDCVSRVSIFNKNLLICAPANSGKSVFAYTVYGILYANGIRTARFMDIVEARSILNNLYADDLNEVILLSTSPILILKIPTDVPSRFPEIMSTIVERRVRNNCSTIFLYNGTDSDLYALDKFGKLKQLFGDGSYNSIEVYCWRGSI